MSTEKKLPETEAECFAMAKQACDVLANIQAAYSKDYMSADAGTVKIIVISNPDLMREITNVLLDWKMRQDLCTRTPPN